MKNVTIMIALNILFAKNNKEEIKQVPSSKHNFEHKKQVTLLLISEGTK